MIQPLTKRQRQVYDFIANTIREKGYAPSLAEIGVALGMTALATVHKHVTTLADKGYVTRRFNHSRSIALLMADGCCPTCGQTMPEATV